MIRRSKFKSAQKVSDFDDVVNQYHFLELKEKMKLSSEGRMILEEQPRVLHQEYDQLVNLRPNTFGYKFGDFMRRNHFVIGDRPLTKNYTDYELAYVKQRYKEIHDFIHVLISMEEISVLNELKVKYFELSNLGLPSCFFASAFGKLLLSPAELANFFVSIPELALKGLNCKMLLGVYFEKHYE